MYSTSCQQMLTDGYWTVGKTYEDLMSRCVSFKTENLLSREYLLHGFLRRLGTLRRSIENVYSLYPVERIDIPSRNECLDLTINLQSFIFNVFGSIDDLAWVWVAENDLRGEDGQPLKPKDIGFCTRSVRKSFPGDLKKYFDGLREWFRYLDDYRHSLAHRIPLYVPPYTAKPEDHQRLETLKNEAMGRCDLAQYERLDAEQEALGKFLPIMMHSYSEAARPVWFHSQVLADWNTVAEIAGKVMDQLEPTGSGERRERCGACRRISAGHLITELTQHRR